MNDTQVLSISITVLAILVGSIYSNARAGDISGSLNRRIDDMRDVLRAEMKAEATQLRAEMNHQFDRMNEKLDVILKVLANHDQRITKLES